MNGKLYIKKFIRDDGETLSFDEEEIYLSENNTLLVRSDPATTAVEFTEEDGGEMIRQRGATYSQPVSGLIVPKSTEYWALCVRLSRFFILNHTYKIVYIKRDGSMFSMNRAWINAGLQIVPVPYENYSTWTIEFKIGDNFWTEYAEDGQGKEIYSNSVELPLLTAGTGGEVWNDVTQQTLSGLGNYFTIDGTSISASINKLEVRGDTFQQTYTGKNLSPYPYSDGSSKVIRGITFTAASDGSVTLNGTNDGTANSAYYIRYSDSSSLQLEAGTYYFIPPSNTAVGYVMYDGTSYYDFSNANNYSQTFSSAKSIRYIYIQVRRGNTTTFNNLKIYPMLTTSPNPTESDYEPYVGGIPAPNPDYPQGIQVVTGEQTVEVTGKNKINGSYSEISQTARCTAEASGNGFKITSTTSSGAVYVTIPIPNIASLLGQTVTVSYSSSGSGIRIGFFYLNSNETATGNVSYTETTTLPSSLGDNAGIGIVFYTSNNGSATYNDIQLEIGSTATDYESYHLQSYEVNLGKNIWNSSMEVGGISSTGADLSNNKRVRSTTKVIVQPRTTYTLSAIPRDSGKVINVAVQGWTSDDTFISQITGADWQTLPLTFTTPANCYKVTLNGRYSDDTAFGTVGESTDAFQNIQLEVGANATEYAPYFTPIELCKIGDYQDYIYKSVDDWYVHKETNKIVLDGSQTISLSNWRASSTSVGWVYAYNVFNSATIVASSVGAIVSDKLLAASFTSLFDKTQDNGIALYTNTDYGLAVRTTDLTLTTTSAINTYLTSNSITVYYPLATPTDTKITNTTLRGQLEALAGAQAYNSKTVYQTNSATMPAILSVELLQSVGGGEVWDNVGAVWEEGVGGVQTINVETTQTTYPVWTVTGPCSNPTLQNDTTDTIASFDGMIASGQTLTVNFADNTAYLDSAPVAKYVSGYVSLAPGENVIGFNSDGGSTQTSTISWDNIIN